MPSKSGSGSLVLENRERCGVVQVVEWIEWTSCADSQAVDEEEYDRINTRHHAGDHVRDKD